MTHSGGAVEVNEQEYVQSRLWQKAGRLGPQKIPDKLVLSWAYLGHQSQVHEEAEGTDDEDKDLVPSWGSQRPWEQISQGGDEALHHDKLGKKHNSFLLEDASFVRSYNVTVVITCVSTARRTSIRKKQALQSCGNGNNAVAWGYVLKARPGPGRSSRRTRSGWWSDYHSKNSLLSDPTAAGLLSLTSKAPPSLSLSWQPSPNW